MAALDETPHTAAMVIALSVRCAAPRDPRGRTPRWPRRRRSSTAGLDPSAFGDRYVRDGPGHAMKKARRS
jgi:hypothetical protein